MLKKCFFCGSKNVVRNGLRGRIQRYKCKDGGTLGALNVSYKCFWAGIDAPGVFVSG